MATGSDPTGRGGGTGKRSAGSAPVLDRIEEVLATLIGFTLGIVLVLMVAAVAYQVFSRFHGIIPFWGGTEEIARGLFVWLVMLGASLGVRSHTHFVVDVLPAATPKSFERAFRIGVPVVVLLVGLVLVVHGWEFALSGLKRRSLVTHLPAIWSYSAILAGGLLITLFALGDLWRTFAGSRERQEAE